MLPACGAHGGPFTCIDISLQATHSVANYPHTGTNIKCIRVRTHRKMLRIDMILLMWSVAENVKFRVCTSSRFSNGAHACCRCVCRTVRNCFFNKTKIPSCQYFPCFIWIVIRIGSPPNYRH